jgi:hypothetical protein
MMPRDTEHGSDSVVEALKPKTFEELKAQPVTCKRFGNRAATHTLSMTVAEIGKGSGSTVTNIPKVPVCEPCGVDVFAVVKRALKV